MRFLYVPDQHGAVFFLWGTSSKKGGSHLVRALKRRGRRATMTVVDSAARLVETSGSAIALAHALPLLAAADPGDAHEAASVTGWVRATKLVSELVALGRMTTHHRVDANNIEVTSWCIDVGDPADSARIEALAATLPYAAFAIPLSDVAPKPDRSVEVYPAIRVLRHFMDAAGDAFVRATPTVAPPSRKGETAAVNSASGTHLSDHATALPRERDGHDGHDGRHGDIPTSAHRLRLRLHIGAPASRVSEVPDDTSEASPPRRSPRQARGATVLGDICEFHWEAALGETSLTPEEFQQLTDSQAQFVLWRDEWVRIEQRHVQAIRPFIGKGGTVSVADALRAALSDEPGEELLTMAPALNDQHDNTRKDAPEEDAWDGLPMDVRTDGAMAMFLARLTTASTDTLHNALHDTLHIDTSALAGTLRPYQERGVRWLATMSALGLGGCLADDMGLGKTIQILAFLLHLRASAPDDPRPSLIVCPTSVAENWVREAHRFAPSLSVVTHYGTNRAETAQALERKAHDGAIVVTTYPILRSDATLLRQIDWRLVVFDEAQQIKNSAAQVSTVARTLRADHRFALTGTPVENRLADLWSILHVTTPGILGTASTFKRAYTTPIEKYGDIHTADRLRRVIAPFILRRVKSDPAVIADLPAKLEREVVCTLTEEQAGLYQATLDDAMQTIVTSAGIARKGHVLALITALKQICNHPSQYLRDAGTLSGRSGKLARLGEMLGEVVAEGERALVFTQFREMGGRLVEYLQSQLDCPILYLHGSTPLATRTQLVEQFQRSTGEPAVFVLSLKAGGTGLNLTAANHVFHFDRWWNPAVEDQATDRAYRIGQDKAVQVHKLVTAGTIEEKIARMMGEKRELSQRIVGAPDRSHERWITELDSAALQELVALSAPPVSSIFSGG